MIETLYSFNTDKKLKDDENVCKNRFKCLKNKNILRHNHGEKSRKIPFFICVSTEYLIEKINTCDSNPGKLSTTQIKKDTTSGYSLFTYCSLDATQNKYDYYREKDCMKKFCKDLKKNATKIINYEKKNKNDTIEK